MKMEISLGPDGNFLLHGRGRTVEIAATPAGIEAMRRVLRNVASGVRDEPGHIAEFPTQHVIDIWSKEFARQRREADIEAASEKLGVDIAAIELDL